MELRAAAVDARESQTSDAAAVRPDSSLLLLSSRSSSCDSVLSSLHMLLLPPPDSKGPYNHAMHDAADQLAVLQVAAQAAALRSELSAAQQALAEVREGAAAAEARAARLDAKAAQQQAVRQQQHRLVIWKNAPAMSAWWSWQVLPANGPRLPDRIL